MKTLTISEANSDLASWLQQAIEGERIGIRAGNRIVALIPMPPSMTADASNRPLSPREALQKLQHDARLTSAQADAYLNEVRAERLAADGHAAA